MKRDMELILRILRHIEQEGIGDGSILAPSFEGTDNAMIAYHVGLCHEAGYLHLRQAVKPGRRCSHSHYEILGLTWAGHEKIQEGV